MSRALGAAFLNHQVEQLEKSVNNRIPGTANWRDRRVPHSDEKHPPLPGALTSRRVSGSPPKQRFDHKPPRDSSDMKQKRGQETKDADVIVLDASVLIHALGQLKKWSREGRKEIIIVPLEGE